MPRSHLYASILLSLCLFGCTSSSSTSSTDATNTDVEQGQTSDTSTSNLPTLDSSAGDSDEVTKKTPEEYMAEINSSFEQAMNDKSIEDLDKSIASAEQAVQEYPKDQKLLQLKALLLFNSLQVEKDSQKGNERRLELGRIARHLLDQTKDEPGKLGQMPNVLLFEEAKGYLASNNTAKAWESLQVAHDNGFDQPRVFYLDESFEPLTTIEEYDAQMRGWVKDEIAALMASFKTFPLIFSLKTFVDVDEGSKPNEVSLADFKGKPVVVDFWGTWCPPCRAALPHLVELHEKHKGELVVLGINFEERRGAKNYDEAKQIYDDFVATEPLPYQCLYGNRGLPEQIPDFKGFPTMVFVDHKGRVRLSLTGYNPAPVLESVVEILLAEKE